MELRNKFLDFFMITLGTAICAAGVYFLLIPAACPWAVSRAWPSS